MMEGFLLCLFFFVYVIKKLNSIGGSSSSIPPLPSNIHQISLLVPTAYSLGWLSEQQKLHHSTANPTCTIYCISEIIIKNLTNCFPNIKMILQFIYFWIFSGHCLFFSIRLFL